MLTRQNRLHLVVLGLVALLGCSGAESGSDGALSLGNSGRAGAASTPAGGTQSSAGGDQSVGGSVAASSAAAGPGGSGGAAPSGGGPPAMGGQSTGGRVEPAATGGQSTGGIVEPATGGQSTGGAVEPATGGVVEPATGGQSTGGVNDSATGGTAGTTATGGAAPVAGAGPTGGADALGGAAGATAGGAAGTLATGGTAGAGGQPPDPEECDSAPADASAAAAEALEIVNALRVPAGAGCATMISTLNLAAQNHCEYYAANTGACVADAHSEVEGCTGFTGTSPGARMTAAGYEGRGSSEVMAFANDPQRAIDMWVNSVWHRVPILSPWVTEFGYGAADGCDTMDFGRGTPLPDDTVVLYPYANQTEVPTTFYGDREGPEPPMPPTGWPSGSPITVYAQDIVVTEHLLTLANDDVPIDHVWITPEDSNMLSDAIMMYAHAPLESQTTYRVRITGTFVGGSLDLDFTFTTE